MDTRRSPASAGAPSASDARGQRQQRAPVGRPSETVEHRLQDSERVIEALLETHSDLDEGVLFVEGERVVLTNSAAERLLGRPRADLVGMPSLFDLVAAPERSRFADLHLRRLAGEDLPGRERVHFERPGAAPLALDVTTRVLHTDEGTRAVLVLRFPLQAETATPPDGTPLRRMESQLQAIEAKFRLLSERTRDLVALVDPDGRYVFASASFGSVLGLEPRLLEGNLVLDLVHKDDRAALAAALTGGPSSPGPTLVRMRHADRSWRWTLLETSRTDHDGRTFTVVFGRDVTERRGAEAERAHVADILDRVHDAVVTIALDGQIIGWNAGAAQVYGFTGKEMVGRNLSLLVPPGAPDDAPLLLDSLRRGETPAPFEADRRRKDGSRVHVRLQAVPLRDAADEIVGASILAIDVSETKRTQRMRATQNEVDHVLAHAASLDGAAPELLAAIGRGLHWDVATLWLASPDGDSLMPRATWTIGDPGLHHFTEATARTTARRGEGVAGIVWATGRPIWIRDVVKERRLRRAAAAAADGLHASAVIPVLSTSGAHGVLEFFARERVAFDEETQRLLLSIGSQLALFLERNYAVDEARRLNHELEGRVTRRLVELETANRELEAFSYSVSHDLKAPLRTIDSFTRNIQEDYASRLDEAGLHLLARIRAATKRMGCLIDDLLKLSHATSAALRKEDVDVSALVTGVAGQLRVADPNRTVDIVVAPGLHGLADPDLLRVAIENLLGNAWKFTRNLPTARIEFTGEQRPGETVYVLRDNGAGFDMTYSSKLFQAFERLHPVSEFEGSGIGLATVQRIIQRHGGRVWAEAKVGEGAVFRFTLGPSPPAAVPVAAAAPPIGADGAA